MSSPKRSLPSAEELKATFLGVTADQRPKSAEALVQLLVERGRLTKFQAKQLLSGAGTPLVLGEYVLLDTIGAGGMGQRRRTCPRKTANWPTSSATSAARRKLAPPAS